MMVLPYLHHTPSITQPVTPDLWFGVAMDAGEADIEIGEGSTIQDNSRLCAGARSRKPARPEPD